MLRGNLSVVNPPNCELPENQLSNIPVTSSTNVDLEAVQPEIDPQLARTGGVVLNWRFNSVTERGVEKDVTRAAKPSFVSVRMPWITGGPAGIVTEVGPEAGTRGLPEELI
jgi:hypothetical protein